MKYSVKKNTRKIKKKINTLQNKQKTADDDLNK